MTSHPASFWDHEPVRPSPCAHRLQVGETCILFDDRAQKLFHQNDAAAVLWEAIGGEGSAAGAARLLAHDEQDYATILAHARQAVIEWLRLGLVRPASWTRQVAADRRQVRLQWMGCGVGLDLPAAMDVRPLLDVFAGFISDDAPALVLDVQPIGDMIFISDDRDAVVARRPDEWIPEVKARFTTRILKTVQSGFLVHAALLSRNGRGLLACGDPGAGKTTLSASLLLAGFDYHADDIVWIGEDGRAVGAPFAPALKQGTWPLLAAMGGTPLTSPAYLRNDGQQVRYLLAPEAIPDPLSLGAILLLARDVPGPARIEAVDPLEVLTAILGSAYSVRGGISGSALRSLGDVVQSARIGRLCFSDWRDARRLVDAFAP